MCLITFIAVDTSWPQLPPPPPDSPAPERLQDSASSAPVLPTDITTSKPRSRQRALHEPGAPEARPSSPPASRRSSRRKRAASTDDALAEPASAAAPRYVALQIVELALIDVMCLARNAKKLSRGTSRRTDVPTLHFSSKGCFQKSIIGVMAIASLRSYYFALINLSYALDSSSKSRRRQIRS